MGDVLSGWVERQYLVQDLMIQFGFDRLLDVTEVDDHALCIQLFGTAIDGDDPIVSMQLLTFTAVGEAKPVCGRDLHSFNDGVHAFSYYAYFSREDIKKIALRQSKAIFD